MSDVSVIVPYFNERGRVERVINTLLDWEVFDRIIAVDDGSDDGGLDIEQGDAKKNLIMVQLPQNQGKGAAVRAGLEKVESTYVMLFDADVQDLYRDDFVKPMHLWRNIGEGMLLYRRVRTFWMSRLMKFDLWLTGERLMRTDDLRAVFEKICPVGYELEHITNQYMFALRKPVVWVPVAAKNTFKVLKQPVPSAMRRELEMCRQVGGDGRWQEYLAYWWWYEKSIDELDMGDIASNA